MCGRYYVDDSTEEKVRQLTGVSDYHIPGGDIHPSEKAAILKTDGSRLTAEEMTWGFPGNKGKGLLINARAETITERRTFKDCVLSRRCVIPAKGFYEWSPGKEKYQFEEPGQTLFLAGCFDMQQNFVIITTAANESVLPVHERMPLLITENEIENWIRDAEYMASVLKRVPQELERWTGYQQMTLF